MQWVTHGAGVIHTWPLQRGGGATLVVRTDCKFFDQVSFTKLGYSIRIKDKNRKINLLKGKKKAGDLLKNVFLSSGTSPIPALQ